MKKESSLRVYLLVGYVAKRVVDPKEIPVSSGRGWGEDGSIPGESHMRAKETTQKPAAHWTNVRYTGSVRCWMASLTQRAWVWVNSGSGDGQGGLACYSPWGRKELDTSEQLNWTKSKLLTCDWVNYLTFCSWGQEHLWKGCLRIKWLH